MPGKLTVGDLLALRDALTGGLNERGNVYLVRDSGHLAFLRLRPGEWLQIQIIPDNYPSLNVRLIEMTAEKLARHINRHCTGWSVRKANLKHLRIVSGHIK